MAVSFKGRRWPLLLTVAACAAAGGSVLAQGNVPEPVRAQVVEGMEIYAAQCASCHGETLDGGQFAQSLADGTFKAKWAGRNAQALFEYIRNSMPPGNARSLSDEAYAALTQVILSRNSIIAQDALTPNSASMIRAQFPLADEGQPDVGGIGGLSDRFPNPPWPKGRTASPTTLL